MFKNLQLLFVLYVLFLPSGLFAEDEFKLDSEDKTYSYAIGAKIGEQLLQQFSSQPGVHIDALIRGMNDAVSARAALLGPEEINAAIEAKQRELLAEADTRAQQKMAQGKAFLEESKKRNGVTITGSGLQYRILSEGEGETPGLNDTVVVHYHGTLIDGTVFDSSYERGQPAVFSLQSIIPGWQEALQLMKPGDKWAVALPPELGYGERGAGQLIGPNEVLLFDIELLEVKQSRN